MDQYEFYFDAIQHKLIRAAAWRQTVAERHPEDNRNLAAMRELSRLAKSRFSDVMPETWMEAAPAFESANLADALHIAARDVAFRSHPADINAFIRTVAKAANIVALTRAAA